LFPALEGRRRILSNLHVFNPGGDSRPRDDVPNKGLCPACGEGLFCCICKPPEEPLEVQFAWTGLSREELEDYLDDFEGDEDAMFGYLWALSKDD
jgi:hypothetical protein